MSANAPGAAKGVTVVGGGTMGVGIAAALVGAGFATEIVEPDRGRAEQIPLRIEAIQAEAIRRGKVTRGEIGAPVVRSSLAETEPRPEAIIEAVPEDLELKRTVLAEAEAIEPKLLASNTSAISIDLLAEGLARPEAFVGMHFFNPVAAMRLVELIVGRATSPGSLERARVIIAALGKESVEVRDVPGFASSRLGVLLGVEAIRMVEEEVAAPAAIDRAMELGYRHPVGPLRLSDIVGLDIRLAIASRLSRVYGERFRPPPLMVEMVERGELGKKTGQGFYTWDSES